MSEDHTLRIVKSRHALAKYRTLPGGTNDRPDAIMKMIRDEIAILEQIAADRGGSETINDLIAQWRDYGSLQRARAH